jgi:ribonucleotide reductase alpha subunit
MKRLLFKLTIVMEKEEGKAIQGGADELYLLMNTFSLENFEQIKKELEREKKARQEAEKARQEAEKARQLAEKKVEELTKLRGVMGLLYFL